MIFLIIKIEYIHINGTVSRNSKGDPRISGEISRKNQQKINNSSIYHSPDNTIYLIQTHKVIS